MAELQASQGSAAVRRALERVVMQGLQPVSIGLAGLFVLFAFTDGAFLPKHARLTVALSDVCVALLMDFAFLAIRLGWIRQAWAHHVAFGTAGAVLAAISISVFSTGQPMQSMGFVLLQLGASMFFLHWPYLIALLVLTDLVWLAAAVSFGFGTPWIEQGTLLASSTVLAGIAHNVRYRSLTRLEHMRIQDACTKAELRLTLAAEERARREAQQSQERFRLVAESTFEGICIHDGVRIVDANPTFATLAGRTLPELVGTPILDLVRPEHRHAVAQRLLVAANDALEVQLDRPDGSSIPVEIRGKPVPSGSGEGFVLAVRDLTPRVRAEQAARLAGERLKEIEVLKQVNAFKTQFINMASHELRTPLTPILLQVRMLKDGTGAELDRQRHVEVLARNIDRLNRLVTDVLDSSRIQAERLVIKPRPVDMEGLARDAVEAVREHAAQGGLEVGFRSEPNLWSSADPDRVHQVLTNLLSNAIKFTPAGGRIEVEVAAVDGQVRTTVRDNGLGITRDGLERLFQPFSQVHDPLANTQLGSGLGLYISRGIVEAHGGRIGADSEGLGQGSAFWFTLPMATG